MRLSWCLNIPTIPCYCGLIDRRHCFHSFKQRRPRRDLVLQADVITLCQSLISNASDVTFPCSMQEVASLSIANPLREALWRHDLALSWSNPPFFPPSVRVVASWWARTAYSLKLFAYPAKRHPRKILDFRLLVTSKESSQISLPWRDTQVHMWRSWFSLPTTKACGL